MILIMSVEPGFGGQKFMDNALDKIKYLDNLRNNNDEYHYLIEVDGGINDETIKYEQALIRIKDAKDIAIRLWYSISNSLIFANPLLLCRSIYALSSELVIVSCFPFIIKKS